MLLLYALLSYIIVRILPDINIWYFVTGIDYNNSSTSIQRQYIHDVVHRAFYFQHFRHCYCCNNCCCCSHINSSLQCVATEQAPRTAFFLLCTICAECYDTRLFLDETHARGAQIRDVTRTYIYVWLFGEESACTTGRWAFGCSDTVMVNI